MDFMDWITIGVGLGSGALGVGIAWGVLRGDIRAVRSEIRGMEKTLHEEIRERHAELAALRSDFQSEARECRENITALLRTLAQGGQQ